MTTTPPTPPPRPSDPPARLALARLALLLQLQQRGRQAARDELPFLFVNETKPLVDYRQAVFWRAARDGRLAVEAVSGLAALDPSAPYIRWLGTLAATESRKPDADRPRLLPDAGAGASDAAPRPEGWAEWLPPHGIWMPLAVGGRRFGVLALFREQPFPPPEQELLSHLAAAYAQSLALGEVKFGRPAVPRRWLWAVAALTALVALAYPVRPSVLAPGEVAPKRPEVVRATYDGVVDRLLVAPGQHVEEGQPLLALEDTQLRTRLLVAKKAEEIAAADYRQLQQLALADPRAKAQLAMARGKIEQLTAERAYVENLLARAVLVSSVAGVALFDQPDEWLGRPVGLGQKIMVVADPGEVQLEIDLPVAEAIELAVGDRVLFFPNIAPGEPVGARLTYVGHRAQETPGTGAAFKLRAGFAPDGAPPLLGLRGTVKLYGVREQPLALVLLRRPIAAVRQWLGW